MKKWYLTLLGISIIFLNGFSFAAELPASLSCKLDQQYLNYAKARTLLFDSIRNNILVTRGQFETLLLNHFTLKFTPKEQNQIRQFHQTIINNTKQTDIRNSIINLDLIRNTNAVTAFCQALPKGGMLHVHPWGTISKETASEILTANDPLIRKVDLDINDLSSANQAIIAHFPATFHFSELNAQYKNEFLDFFVLENNDTPFSQFDAIFSFVNILFSSCDNLPNCNLDPALKIFEDFVIRAKANNVDYVEFTHSLLANELAKYATITSYLESTYDFKIRYNYSFFRNTSIPDEENTTQFFLDNYESQPYFIGIDLLDNEVNNPALEKGQYPYIKTALYNQTHNNRWHFTMHSGEMGDSRDPRDAMIIGAERIGHGVLLHNDLIALEYARRTHLPIEINLTSNVILGAIPSYQQHPFLNYLRLGLPVSLSTDDEGIFETTISQECVAAINNSDINYYELKEMVYNSIRTSFLTANEKQALLTRLDAKFVLFESNHFR